MSRAEEYARSFCCVAHFCGWIMNELLAACFTLLLFCIQFITRSRLPKNVMNV